MPVALVVKKLLSRLLFPLPLFLIVAFEGCSLAFSAKSTDLKRKLGRAIIMLDLLLLYLGGTLGDVPLHYLSTQYAPLDAGALARDKTYAICVFCSSYVNDDSRPPETRFIPDMVNRLAEAARIANALENNGINYRVFVSVQHPDASQENKMEAAIRFMHSMGVPASKVSVLENNAYNTQMELEEFMSLDNEKIFVSTAWHLPRIMYLAGLYGASALPAPAGGSELDLSPMPSAATLASLRNAAYEGLGMFEYWLRSQCGRM